MEYTKPIYDISIKEALHLGVDEVAFVHDPAIQELWVAMANEITKLLLSEDDKMIVTGPALVPDKLIYRVHPKTGQEYYIRFSEETIQAIVTRYFTQNKQINFNLEHNKENDVQGVILESWIVKDPNMDQSVTMGFKNLKKGTWMISVKVEDHKFWNDYVKTGQVRGFSIEGSFAQSLAEAMAKQEALVEPKAGESKDEYISRCVAYHVGQEGMESDQAYAICETKWSTKMSKYEYPVGDFLSGFSEDESNPCEYEIECQKMVIRGVEYFDMHPELHELISKGGVSAFDEAAKPLIKHMCTDENGKDNGATGAMVEHTAKHAYYAYKVGWDEYIKKMTTYELSQQLSKLKGVSEASFTELTLNDIELESYTDYPQVVSDNAQRALDWAEENTWGTCGTAVGKQRANQLAKREPISEETISRMASFARHLQYNDKELGDGCAKLMILAWGGKEGIEWAQRKLDEIQRLRVGEKVSFDWDGVLNTRLGKMLAKKEIQSGSTVYIISARNNAGGMYAVADELGIPHDRVIATGSNLKKAEMVKELGIDTHYDNNRMVRKLLPKGVGVNFTLSEQEIEILIRAAIEA